MIKKDLMIFLFVTKYESNIQNNSLDQVDQIICTHNFQ